MHLVPRLADHPADAIGPEVFILMTEDPQQWLPEAERDSVALAVRGALELG